MSARFADGTRVRVKALLPPGHCRTPFYTRGRLGTVLGIADRQPNPEALAYGRTACRDARLSRPLRRGRIMAGEPAVPGDAVVVDLFEPWLEPLDGSKP